MTGSDDMAKAALKRPSDWLATANEGRGSLHRDQVTELVSWKFQSMPHRKMLAMRGICPERWKDPGGAAELIGKALAASDDYDALALTARSGGGTYRLPSASGASRQKSR